MSDSGWHQGITGCFHTPIRIPNASVKEADSRQCLVRSPRGFAFSVVLLNPLFPCCLVGFSLFKEEIHLGQICSREVIQVAFNTVSEVLALV